MPLEAVADSLQRLLLLIDSSPPVRIRRTGWEVALTSHSALPGNPAVLFSAQNQ